MPTRADVLALRSIEDAFDLTTTVIMPWELGLIRVAARERLVDITQHASLAAADEHIEEKEIIKTVRFGRAASKDVDLYGSRQVGINFERTVRDGRRIRVKVSWERRHYTVTVHTI